jgi:hypothetical protein
VAKPYGDEVVTVAVQVAGLRAAIERLEAASARKDDPQGTYLPLFEALNWAAAIDYRIGVIWRPDGKKLAEKSREKVTNGAVIAAIDWARNLVHHQWADALRLDPSGHGLYPSKDLFPSPDLYPRADHAWVWKDLDELPKRRRRSKKKRQEDEAEAAGYVEHLQGRSAAETLRVLLADFEFVAELLEPPRPDRPAGAAESD